MQVGAEGGIRTPTGRPTRPSSVRVCQFHHFGTLGGASDLRGRGDSERALIISKYGALVVPSPHLSAVALAKAEPSPQGERE